MTCRICCFYQVKATRPELSSILGSYKAYNQPIVFVKLHRPSQEKKDGKQVLLKSRPSRFSLLHYRMSQSHIYLIHGFGMRVLRYYMFRKSKFPSYARKYLCAYDATVQLRETGSSRL